MIGSRRAADERIVHLDIVRRHAEDASFLWLRRNAMLRTNRFKHVERARLDMRIEANLDGLFIAGEAGWRASIEELVDWPHAGAVFAATAVALGGDETDARMRRVFELSARCKAPFAPMVSGVGWSPLERVRVHLARWRQSADPFARRLALAGALAHRECDTSWIREALESSEAEERALGAKGAEEMGTAACAPLLVELLEDSSPAVRVRAASALARLGEGCDRVAQVLLSACATDDAERAVAGLAFLAPRERGALFETWRREPSTRALAILLAENVGDPIFVDDLISWMDDDATSRAAGEAFRTITGADLEEEKLSRPRPEHVRGDPTDAPNDRDVVLDREYAVPFASAMRVMRWWRTQRGSYARGDEYLDGIKVAAQGRMEPSHQGHLRELATNGRPRHQTLAARRLATATHRARMLETHAPATQRRSVPGLAPAEVHGDQRAHAQDAAGAS